MSITLDEVRGLNPEELYEPDIEVLREHKEELTDEEKQKFDAVLEVPEKKEDDEDKKEEEAEEKPEEKPDEKAEDKPEDKKEEEPKEEEKSEKKEEPLVFKTREELDQYIASQVTKVVPKVEPKKEEEKEEDPLKEMFPDDFVPENWREVASRIVKFQDKQKEITNRKVQKEIDDINAGFTRELDDLRNAGEPIPAAGTKELEELDKELTSIGLKYHIPTFKDAYAVYKQIQPKEKVEEKEEEKPDEKPEEKPEEKKVNKENIELAKKVGGQSAPEGKKDTIKYKDIAGKTPRQIVDQFQDELD